MIRYLKKLDTFHKNIILVFIGSFSASFLNLLYQLLIAHRLSPSDFAATNSLLSICMLISLPLSALQTLVAKYTAEFNAQANTGKIKEVISSILRRVLQIALLTFFVFFIASPYIIAKLKIATFSLGYILAFLLSLSWPAPVLLGGLQGLELFRWLVFASLASGVVKFILAFLFISWGLSVTGALSAFLISALIIIIIPAFALKRYLSPRPFTNGIDFREIFIYILPVAISYFCFACLINLDIVLVKYYFSPQDAGLYSLAQIVGKIFLFLPGAISIVMFPRTSNLSAQKMDTISILKRSLLYAVILCSIAGIVYNSFPSLVLSILTGKVYPESVLLGRIFGISMTFFALTFILITYFLSVKDMRFVKHLILFTGLQYLAIVFFHKSLVQIQLLLSLNAILLFSVHLTLAYKRHPVIRNKKDVLITQIKR